jgi:hypothetical protein
MLQAGHRRCNLPHDPSALCGSARRIPMVAVCDGSRVNVRIARETLRGLQGEEGGQG